ncbi:hypothetical protein ACFE04_026347 [Oxalis oulophora]
MAAAHEHHHHHHHHHQQLRPNRISVPSRTTTTQSAVATPYSKSKSNLYSLQSSISFKRRTKSSLSSSSSIRLVLIFLFSLRSFYTLLPFIRSSPPSFSLFPFSFLVSLLSFLLSLTFSKSLFKQSISISQFKLLFLKSSLLAIVFLLRFQALRYCGTAALILADLSGNILARLFFHNNKHNNNHSSNKELATGFFSLFAALLLLSFSWDRLQCFPFSHGTDNYHNCFTFWPMLLPFLSGFLACYERHTNTWGSLTHLPRKLLRLYSLFFTTILLFIPAAITFIVYQNQTVSFTNLAWPLANTVVFGVLLTDNYIDGNLLTPKDFRRDFFATFLCTIVLELFYFPQLSLWGLLLCGGLLYVAVTQLDPLHATFLELGMDSSESITAQVMKPIRHILSERKSRKIALFLFINTAYMVVEFVAGFMSNSLGLISDACHMLFDCAALAIGLYASYISRLPANSQFNYGRGRFEVLSGYVNAVLLVLVGILIVLESFERILDPQEISTNSLLTVSIGGLLVNVVGLIFFHEEHHHAHGGSCSHSHSHSHSHDHHSHSHDDLHVHETHKKHHDCITVSPVCQEKSCSNSHDHHHALERGHAQNHHEHHGHSHAHDVQNRHEHNDHSHAHDVQNRHKHNDQHSHSHEHQHAQHNDHDHHDDVMESLINDSSRNLQSLHTHIDLGGNKKKHNHIDHNMEGIFLHVLADTLGSVGVVISTLLIKYKGWVIADPACSIFISVLIVSSVIPLLRNSAEILLQRVPRAHEEDLKDALNDVMKIKGVHGIHKMHMWSFTNSEIVGTLHLHVSTEADKASTKARVSDLLHDAGIKDLTVQLECVK